MKTHTRARSRWGAIANPTLKFLTPPVAPRGMNLAKEWKLCSICFSIFYLWEHTQSLVYDMLMIFDLLASPKVTSLTLGWKCYLHSVLLVIPVDLISHMIMFENIFWPPGYPQFPKVPPLGHDTGDRIKIPSNIFVSFICENTHKVWYKNLWHWHGNRNLMIIDLWPHPKVTSLTLGWKFYLHSVLLVIPVNLICHMTTFEKKKYPLGTQAPQSPTQGDRMKISSDMFWIFHLWEHTQSLVQKSLKLTL